MPELHIPNFELVRVIADGGMSRVYLARQHEPNRQAAVKIVSLEPDEEPSFLACLKEEGDTVARLNHDNVVKVYACGVIDDYYYLAMELLSGGDLTDKIAAGIEPTKACGILRQIAAALQHAHSRQTLHRDIKPGNILFDEHGKAVLVDFGIAKEIDTQSPFTKVGAVVGTPHYLAPERTLGKGCDERSDLYSLGVVFFEMLTGKRPFSGSDPVALSQAHVNEPVPQLPDELHALQAIMDRLLDKNPKARFQSAQQLIQELDNVEHHALGLPKSVRLASAQQSPALAGDMAPAVAGFKLGRVLARGASSSVHIAEQEQPRRRVAVKLVQLRKDIDPSFLKRLQQEGDFAAQFNHPNLVTVYSCGVEGGNYYLAMEYLSGGTLKDRIQTGMSDEEIIQVTSEIASGLDYIHQRGTVHRDIKPANILFNDQGRGVLVDFGIAKQLQADSTLTQLGIRSGTPLYMSPEQTQRQDLDGRSDLYSLGIVLYEMLTGKAPFVSDEELAVAYGHVHEEPADLPREKARFQSVVNRLLAKNPGRRYASARDLISDLQALDSASESQNTAPDSTLLGSSSWWRELVKRRIFRTAAIYTVLAWGFTEMSTTVLEGLSFPTWTITAVLVLFILGFPVAISLAWMFDIGKDGVRRVPPSSGRGLVTMVIAASALISSTALIVVYLKGEVASGPAQSPSLSAVTTQIPRVAVMPFTDMSLETQDAYFGEGIAEELLNHLSSHRGVRVIARSSSFNLARAGLDEIRQRLNVTYVVEGSIRETDDEYAISARLVDAASGEQAWFGEYEATGGALFTVQTQMARELLAELTETDPINAVVAQTGTQDVEAYRAYLRGKHAASKGDMEQSRNWFKQAVDLDPGFALAFVGLARGYYMPMFLEELRDHPYMEIALNMAKRALLLDPELLEAHAALAMIHGLRYNWLEARESFDRAMALSGPEPANPDLGMVANMLGHYDLAASITKRRYETDPANPMAINGMVTMFYKMGNLEEVLRYSTVLKEMGMVSQGAEAYALRNLGDTDGAIDSLAATYEFWGQMLEQTAVGPFPARKLAVALIAASSDPSEQPEAVAIIQSVMSEFGYPDTVALWDFALINAPDETFGLAEKLWADRRFNQHALWQPEAAVIRADPRFIEMMEQIGLMEYWRLFGPPDFCKWHDNSLDCSEFTSLRAQ